MYEVIAVQNSVQNILDNAERLVDVREHRGKEIPVSEGDIEKQV